MKSELVKQFLADKGYKSESPHAGDSPNCVANYYRVMYGAGLPNCLTNDKPPQMCIVEYYLDHPNMPVPYHSFDIGIRNHAPQGWISFKFYTVAEADLLRGYENFEAALLNAWRGLFEAQEEARQNER